MNTIAEIAGRLTSLCSDLNFVDVYNELFATDAVSIDPIYKNEPLTGLVKLVEREKNFLSANTIGDIKLSAPIFSGSYFSLVLSMTFTPEGQPTRSIEELCVYKVNNGKIISQQFFIG